MLLDLYYKMQWWYAVCAAKAEMNASIPQVRLANGNLVTSIIWSHNTTSGGYMYGMVASRCMLTKPIASMLSQKSSLSVISTGYYINTNMIVGSGTTPVTSSDYMVENEITTGLTCENVSATVNNDAGTIVLRKVLTNTSSSEITINEVGLTSPFSTEATVAYQALIYREVFDKPLVIAPGETATIAITIKHPFVV